MKSGPLSKKETKLAILGVVAGLVLGLASLSIDWSFGELPRAEDARQVAASPQTQAERVNAVRALYLAKTGKYDDAIELVRDSALSGVSSAQYVVGTMHANGWGTPVDLGEAAVWWTRSAKQGHANATFWLGLYLMNGDQRARRDGWALVEAASTMGSAGASGYIRQIEDARIATAESYYERLRDDVLRAILAEQGGRISLGQMQALRGIGPSFDDAYEYAIQDRAIARNIYNDPSATEGLAVYGERGFRSKASDMLRKSTEADDRRTDSEIADAFVSLPNSDRTGGGLINPSNGEYFASSGAGYTSTRNGTFYAQSGPNGVTDTRTGQFIPIN